MAECAPPPQPGEWWFDQDRWQLYVWMPDGAVPSRLSVKVNDFCLRKEAPAAVTLQQQQQQQQHTRTASGPARPVRLEHLSFHGCTVELLDCHNCSVQNVQLTYPNYESHWIDGSCGKVLGHKCQMPAMTLLQGSNSVLHRVYLVHS